MTGKKKIQFIALVSVFVVLLICYLGINFYNKKQEEKEAQEAEADIIYMTDISDVTAVSYQGGTEVLSFAKNGDGEWYSADDEEFPLNPDTVEAIVSCYGKLVADRELKDGDDISAYGLDEPTYYVTLTDTDGNQTTVNIGNVVDDDYYAMVDGEDTVYTITSSDITDLQTTLTDMAALDTFPSIGSGNIVSEKITKGSVSTTYKTEDEEAIAVVAGGLTVVSLDTPVDYHMADGDASKYGLDKDNRTTVTVTYTENEEEQSVTFYLGNEDGNGNRYVQMDGSKIIYTVTTATCNNILNESDGE